MHDLPLPPIISVLSPSFLNAAAGRSLYNVSLFSRVWAAAWVTNALWHTSSSENASADNLTTQTSVYSGTNACTLYNCTCWWDVKPYSINALSFHVWVRVCVYNCCSRWRQDGDGPRVDKRVRWRGGGRASGACDFCVYVSCRDYDVRRMHIISLVNL